MPTYKNKFVIFLLWLLLPALAPAQCYSNFLAAGKKSFRELKFEEAINQFEAAKVCEDTIVDLKLLDSLIQKSQEEYIKEIKRARNAAELQRRRADSARVVAQANQLALLSRNAQAVRQDSNALIFAYGARALFGEQVPDPIVSNFGQAAFNFYKRSLPGLQGPVTGFWPVPGMPFLLVETGRGKLYRIKETALQADGTLDLEFIGDHQAYLTDIAYHAAGGVMICSAQDRTAVVRSLNGHKTADLPGHQDQVNAVAVSADGSRILTCDRAGSGKVWSREGKLFRSLTGHTGAIYQAFFVGDDQVVTRAADRKIGLWNIRDQTVHFLQHEEQSYFNDLQYFESRQRLFTLNTRGEIQIWDLNGALVNTITHKHDPIRHFQINEAGKIIAAGSKPVVSIWDADGNDLETLPIPQLSGIRFFRYSTLYHRVFAGAEEGIVSVDLNSMDRVFFPARPTPMETLLSPDGRYLLATYSDGMARLWSANGLLLFEFSLNTRQPIPVVFGKSGQYIMASVNDNQEIIWAPLPEVAWAKLPSSFSSLDQQLERLGKENGMILSLNRAKDR